MQGELEGTDSEIKDIPLFVYGTLMIPNIYLSVITQSTNRYIPDLDDVGRNMPKTFEATLKQYKRLQVKRAHYPAIIPASEQDSVKGLLYFVETEADMEHLDWYESSRYERIIVPVEIKDEKGNTRTAYANTYVWNDDKKCLETHDWDFEAYLNMKKRIWNMNI
ncbi:hypothetical protein HK098_005721 [Nowakowskiella sp. JEL0407]|nr:hypothetical protein HK098_005721 [Nowakowskiella sp. JEL0407]